MKLFVTGVAGQLGQPLGGAARRRTQGDAVVQRFVQA